MNKTRWFSVLNRALQWLGRVYFRIIDSNNHHSKETRYKTDAEKFGNSYVFDMCLEKEVLEASTQAVQVAPWWIQIDGASWKSPEGGKDWFTDNITDS